MGSIVALKAGNFFFCISKLFFRYPFSVLELPCLWFRTCILSSTLQHARLKFQILASALAACLISEFPASQDGCVAGRRSHVFGKDDELLQLCTSYHRHLIYSVQRPAEFPVTKKRFTSDAFTSSQSASNQLTLAGHPSTSEHSSKQVIRQASSEAKFPLPSPSPFHAQRP